MIHDEWMHWEDALDKLDNTWQRDGNWIVKLNEHGVPMMKSRIYDGSEHELAKKDHIIVNTRYMKGHLT
jgi:hypothetical protein